MDNKNLTPKQKAFADYYIELGNATEAYIKAGYNKKGARANSARLIASDSIKQYIEEGIKVLEDARIAKDFYLKNGYKNFGVLEDCPEGHKLYHLSKRL